MFPKLEQLGLFKNRFSVRLASAVFIAMSLPACGGSDSGTESVGGGVIPDPSSTPTPTESATPTPSPTPSSIPTPTPTSIPIPIPIPTPGPSPVTSGCSEPVFSSSFSQNDIKTSNNIDETDTNNRWSENGANGDVWLQADCGALTDISGISIEFFKGDEREALFDLEGSIDGKHWVSLKRGLSSSGITTQAEYFAFDETKNLRHVRYVGYGNSVSSWNSLREFNVIKTGDQIPDKPAGATRNSIESNCPGIFDLPRCMEDMSYAGGGTIILANKTYRLTESLMLKDNVNIVGQPDTVITFDDSLKDSVNEALLYSSGVNNVALKNVKLLCTIDQNPQSNDIRTEYMGVFLDGAGDPSYGESTSNNNIYMESIEVKHCSNGMYLKGLIGFTGIDLHLHHNGNTEFDLFHNLYLKSVADVTMIQTTEINAGFYAANRGQGIRMSNVSNVYYENLKVYDNAKHGLYLTDGSFDVRFHNLDVFGNCASPIQGDLCDAVACYGADDECDIDYNSAKETLNF